MCGFVKVIWGVSCKLSEAGFCAIGYHIMIDLQLVQLGLIICKYFESLHQRSLRSHRGCFSEEV